MSDRARAAFFLGLGTLMWGSTFLVIKPLVSVMSPMVLLVFRFGIASAALLPFAIRASQKSGRPPMGGVALRGLILGIALLGGYSLQTAGLQYSGPGKSAFITSLYVAFAPFASWPICGRKPTGRHFISVAAALVGVFLLTAPLGNPGKGDVLTFLSALCWAVEIALIDRFWTPGRELEMTVVQLSVVAASSALLVPVTGGFRFEPDVFTIPALLYLAVPATSMLMYWQLRWQPSLGGELSSLIYIGEAVVASVGGAVFFSERFGIAGWFGCGLIAASILIGWPGSNETLRRNPCNSIVNNGFPPSRECREETRFSRLDRNP